MFPRYRSFCDICATPVYTDSTQIRVCSLECAKKWILKDLQEKEGEIRDSRQYHRACPLCAKNFITTNKKCFFCNNNCAIKYTYKLVNGINLPSLSEFYCKNCGEVAKASSCNTGPNRRFCNSACSRAYHAKELREQREKEREENPKKKKKRGKTPEELMAIEDKKEKARLFKNSVANAYIRTGKGFNL